MFLKGALQKAEDQRTRESVEFRAKQLHQKPEIAKIEILATRENEVLVTVFGQVIRTGIFQEKAFTESFNFKSRGHEQKSDAVRCAQFGLWRGARRAHPRSGLQPTSNKATGQIGRNPRASVLFGSDFVACSSQTAGGYAPLARPARTAPPSSVAELLRRTGRLNRKFLAANATGFLFMTTQPPSAPQSQHGPQRTLSDGNRRVNGNLDTFMTIRTVVSQI